MRIFAIQFFFFAFSFSLFAFAAPEAVIKGGVVSEDGAYVFTKPSFDAEVITTLAPGGVYFISKALINGVFHKIKVKTGVMGYVSNTDIRPLTKKEQQAVPVEELARKKTGTKKSGAKNSPKQRSFEFSRYWGPQLAMIDFKEDTMGDKRHGNLNFYGAKFSGSNVLVSGATQTDVNILLAPTAPSYYEGVTKRSATGFVFIANFLMETYWPQSPTWMYYFGFGPMFRYSNINATFYDTTNARDVNFSLEDMTIGAVFHTGMAFRLGRTMALRVEAQYYWETQPYFGFSLAPQFSF
jgi:hypothetical protein